MLSSPVTDPPVVQLDIIQPMSQTVIESNPSSLIALRCTTIQGNPSQLTQVQWYHNGHHFMTTLSVRQLNQLNGVGVINGISNGPNFYRVGMGKHFTLIDESTNTNEQVGPIDGTLLAFNDSTLSQAPYVQYLDSPNLLTISNVSRIHAGNYSCLGFNGAANSSTSSLAKTIFVKCKFIYLISHYSIFIFTFSNTHTRTPTWAYVNRQTGKNGIVIEHRRWLYSSWNASSTRVSNRRCRQSAYQFDSLDP